MDTPCMPLLRYSYRDVLRKNKIVRDGLHVGGVEVYLLLAVGGGTSGRHGKTRQS